MKKSTLYTGFFILALVLLVAYQYNNLMRVRMELAMQKNNMNATFNENLLKFIWPFDWESYITPEQFHADLEQCEGGFNGSMLQYFTQARLGWPKEAI